MGKLHRIRKAFNKLPEERKREVGAFVFRRNAPRPGCIIDEHGVRFRWYVPSHRDYTMKLCRDHFGGVAQ